MFGGVLVDPHVLFVHDAREVIDELLEGKLLVVEEGDQTLFELLIDLDDCLSVVEEANLLRASFLEFRVVDHILLALEVDDPGVFQQLEGVLVGLVRLYLDDGVGRQVSVHAAKTAVHFGIERVLLDVLLQTVKDSKHFFQLLLDVP